MTNKWLYLEEVQKTIADGGLLPPRMPAAIAERISEAILSPTRAAVSGLSEQLAEFLDVLEKAAPEPARFRATQTFGPDNIAYFSYQLGQVSFAQMLIAQVSERRIDDDFSTIVGDIRYKSYVDALRQRELSGKQLSEVCLECVETVSRKLRQLRELGITDFRREGTSFVNFLTPAARAIVKQTTVGNAASRMEQRVNINAAQVEIVMKNTPEKMRAVPMFGRKAA